MPWLFYYQIINADVTEASGTYMQTEGSHGRVSPANGLLFCPTMERMPQASGFSSLNYGISALNSFHVSKCSLLEGGSPSYTTKHTMSQA